MADWEERGFASYRECMLADKAKYGVCGQTMADRRRQEERCLNAERLDMLAARKEAEEKEFDEDVEVVEPNANLAGRFKQAAATLPGFSQRPNSQRQFQEHLAQEKAAAEAPGRKKDDLNPAQREALTQLEELIYSDDDELGLDTPKTGIEMLYIEENNAKFVLVAASQGLKQLDGRVMADLENDPIYRDMPPGLKSLYHPQIKHLKKEVERRSMLTKQKVRMKSANKTSIMGWLKMNPDQDKYNVSWIRQEETKMYLELKAAKEESDAQEKEKLKNANWSVPAPFLRLACCLVHDKVKSALMMKDATLLRDELDARNNQERPKLWNELAAEVYNDNTVVFYTEALPELHMFFAEPIELKFEEMPGGAVTPEEVKTRWGDCRARLIAIIMDWERSGNGFGQRDQKDKSWGHFSPDHLNLEAGDNRASFIRPALGHRLYHLYLWHLADKEGILMHVLNVLAKDVGGDSDNIPGGTSQVQRRRKRIDEGKEETKRRNNFRTAVSSSLKDIAVSNRLLAVDTAIANKEEGIRHEETKVHQFNLAKLRERTEELRDYYGTLIDHHKDRVGDLYDELAALKQERVACMTAAPPVEEEENHGDDEE
ncbi:unknown protein [Seminavis robusta]|uniref:Uncharacterized protein n=1 Tax=Seminavis robusta TaxID=568900 RepID=A0A9N8E6L5_9STRA|nr:unknown protein [Seminavis robusta]|eukprot:Sro605_g174210.1 n/a (600) ;mRNA; f:1973-3843